MENLYRPTSKTFLEMAGGRMHTPHSTPLDLPLAISYRNYQKSMAYFSHLALSVLFFFTKKLSQRGGGGGMAQCPHKYAPDFMFCNQIQCRGYFVANRPGFE